MGSLLHASPRRGRLKMLEETKVFLSCGKKLSFVLALGSDDDKHPGHGIILTKHKDYNYEDSKAFERSGCLRGG